MSTVPEREDIDEEYKWDLASIFPDEETWQEAYDDVEERVDDLRDYEGRATESAETLVELLEQYETVMRDVAKVAAYARLRSAEDTRNQEYQAISAKAESLQSEASSATSYLEPELQELDWEEVEALMAEEPELEEYEHFFDDALRMKPHTRSAEVEELLADLSEITNAPSDIYGMLSNADLTFPTVEKPDGEEVEITQSNFTKLQKHENREFRRETYEQYYETWDDYRNSVGTSLQNSVKKDVKLAEARNYDTAREAALDDTNVPTAVYDNLVDTVHDNLDSLQRHADLKRQALGVDELGMHDVYMSLTGEEGPDVTYEQAKEWVVEAVAPLGEEYQARMEQGLESRWVDVYENRGKRSGAFSSGTYDTQPFILMNYQDDVSSMYTLAHELGHSMHSELAAEEQPWQYSSYEIFVAEVASTVNETLLTHYLLENVDDDEIRAHALDQYLERFRSTLFRQTMFADFEQRVHERAENGQPLTPDAFDEVYGGLKEEFYANADVDDLIAKEWMRIPHFYYNFYVYQYSTGISAAVAIVEKIREEGESAAADYRAALEAGGSEYPMDVLEIAGIDMTSPEPIESALSVYDDRLDDAAALLDLE
ncbi:MULTISPECIES: oligoendopeptidase F [Halolamina]|uniref:Oligoendopeptidase F n=1 Tax=Halolamina pelagica TaxID=699431 RepID=A0A1I5PYU8_9EURY|nr:MULTISPECIES: oligoendopeptidase F [Halolamina]NHX35018.1 oligoendopeptidase F [Halolamina sp. R1-12]SFP39202.1 oligoendopeptidase F [Halolamina pelagica]